MHTLIQVKSNQINTTHMLDKTCTHGEPDRSDLDCKIFLIKFCRDSFINIKK